MPIPTETIAKLRGLLARTTPTPWCERYGFIENVTGHTCIASIVNCDGPTLENRELICEAVNNLPDLLTELDRLRELPVGQLAYCEKALELACQTRNAAVDATQIVCRERDFLVEKVREYEGRSISERCRADRAESELDRLRTVEQERDGLRDRLSVAIAAQDGIRDGYRAEIAAIVQERDGLRAEVERLKSIMGRSVDASACVLADLDRVEAERAAMRAQRDALALDLWSAEDQWGEDYLWEKWELSRHLTPELKDALRKSQEDRAAALLESPAASPESTSPSPAETSEGETE